MSSTNGADPPSFYDQLAAASPAYAALKIEKEVRTLLETGKKVQASRREYFKSNSKSGQVTPSPLPYAKHFASILPRTSSLFKKQHRHFVDVGSAPGGLCRYLCKDLKWSGRAFSLSEKDGGFKMCFGGGERLKFSRCDVSKPGAWETLHSKLEEKADPDGRFLKFDFANLGITLQWQHPRGTSDEATKRNQHEAAAAVDITPPRNNRLVLQEVIRNELLFALKALKQGGSLMITLPTSDHPNTFLYLSYLRKCSKKRIRINPTNKLVRNPVYVFVEKIDLEGDGVKSFTKFLESTEASPENDSKWSIASWDEARPIFEECRSDLEKLWRCQLRALKEERLEMERREFEEEKLVDLDRWLEEVAVGGETG